ncbi:MAG: hypothetical protein ACE5FT_06435, partial [Candidatus Nanoarchaeia archaeon]
MKIMKTIYLTLLILLVACTHIDRPQPDTPVGFPPGLGPDLTDITTKDILSDFDILPPEKITEVPELKTFDSKSDLSKFMRRHIGSEYYGGGFLAGDMVMFEA